MMVARTCRCARFRQAVQMNFAEEFIEESIEVLKRIDRIGG